MERTRKLLTDTHTHTHTQRKDKNILPWHTSYAGDIITGLTLKPAKMNIHVVEFANSGNSDMVAHSESSHLDLHCLTSSLWYLTAIQLG